MCKSYAGTCDAAFVAGVLCWELARVNIVSWLSRSPHVIFQLFIPLDSVIVGYSITMMDWQRKTDKRSVLVQSRMKSRIWRFDLIAGHFSQTVAALHLVLGLCRGN